MKNNRRRFLNTSGFAGLRFGMGHSLLIFALAIILGTSCKKEQKESSSSIPKFEWMSEVGAKEYPKSDSIYHVKNYGAVGDGVTLCTQNIQKAIDDCHAHGGGRVTFDAGIYVTGSLFIKSGVDFHIPKGAMLAGSLNIDDYVEIPTRVAGIETRWPSAMINIIGQNNAAISGDGTVHGRGKPFWDKFWEMYREYNAKGLRWAVDYDCRRPRGILVSNSANITVKDIVVYQAGFWATHILYSNNVTVEGLTIKNNIEGHGPSTDGIDIDSSEKILVRNCIIDCNDDNFCLKAGRDADGLRVNRPCEYIVIHDCVALAGHGLLTFGSETSGGFRHIVAYNMKSIGTSLGVRFKSSRKRGGILENIYLSDFEMTGVHNCLSVDFDWLPSYSVPELPEAYKGKEIPEHWKTILQKVDSIKGMPLLRNVYIENMKGVNANICIDIQGNNVHPVEGFHFKNVSLQGKQAGRIKWAKDWTAENVTIKGDEVSQVKLEDCENINLQ